MTLSSGVSPLRASLGLVKRIPCVTTIKRLEIGVHVGR